MEYIYFTISLIVAMLYIYIGHNMSPFISGIIQSAMPRFPSEIKLVFYTIFMLIWPAIIVLSALLAVLTLPFNHKD